LKLNLGCGLKKLDGFVNVDKHGEPDLRHDLEVFPWPWADSSVDQVRLIHVLEHLGRDPDVFIGVMKELYRVCRGGAEVHIVVPHPRHDNFLADPTHVRPILLDGMLLFDRRRCEEWQRGGYSNTPLALYHDVDFETVSYVQVPDEPWLTLMNERKLSVQKLEELARTSYNVIVEIQLTLRVRK
jgi:hypothetical protein